MFKEIKQLAIFLAGLGTVVILAPTPTQANNSNFLTANNSINLAQFVAPPPSNSSYRERERNLNVCSNIPKGWVAIYVSSRVCGVGVMTIKDLSQEPIGSKLLMCSARSRVPEGWVVIYDGDAKYDTQASCRVITIEKVS